MNQRTKTFVIILISFVAGLASMYLFKTYTLEKRIPSNKDSYSNENTGENPSKFLPNKNNAAISNEISKLTEEKRVIDYVKTHHQLPDYYLTKKEAKKQGWIPSKGNLCDVLPGKAIGGDHFSNREKLLPTAAKYYEADVNYQCGRRTTDRIIYTENGRVWITHNHYKTFEEQ